MKNLFKSFALILVALMLSQCYFETSKKVQSFGTYRNKDKNTLFIFGRSVPIALDQTTSQSINFSQEASQPLFIERQNLSLSVINHKTNTVVNVVSDLELSNQDSLVLKGFLTKKNKRIRVPVTYNIGAEYFDDLDQTPINGQTLLVNTNDILGAEFSPVPISPPKDTLLDVINNYQSIINDISNFSLINTIDSNTFSIDSFRIISTRYINELNTVNSILTDTIPDDQNQKRDSLNQKDSVVIGQTFLLTQLEKKGTENVVNSYHGYLRLADGTELEFFALTDPLPLLPIAIVAGVVGTGALTYNYWDKIKKRANSIKAHLYSKKGDNLKAQNNSNSGR